MVTKEMKDFVTVKAVHDPEKTITYSDTFRKLHFEFGFNFEKPFNYVVLNEKFTLRTVRSAVECSLATETVVLLYGENYNQDRLYCVRIIGDGPNGYSIETEKNRSNLLTNYHKSYDTFIRKTDFESARKNSTRALVISQSIEYLSEIKRKNSSVFLSDNNERFSVINVITGLTYNGEIEYISQVDFSPIHSHGEKYNWQFHDRIIFTRDVKNYLKIITDVFDKSGYFVVDRRNELKRKAEQTRSEKAKQAFIDRSYNEELKSLETLKEKALETLKEKAGKARTHDELLELSRKIDNYTKGLAWIIYDNNLFNDRIMNKKYNSNKKAVGAYEEIKTKYENFISEWKF